VRGSLASIQGVTWGRVARHADERGSFREAWRASAFAAEHGRFVQANVSLSGPGVLRGLHYHRGQLDHWVVLAGRVFVALVDLRALRTDPRAVAPTESRTIGADETVTIPPYVAHGFLALEPTELLYLVTNEYDGSDERGIAWDDPELAVPWPVAGLTGRTPILSPRDRASPRLRELGAV